MPEPEEGGSAAKPGRRFPLRRVLLVAARFTTGLTGVGAAVAVVLAASVLPGPAVRAVPDSEFITPIPTGQQLLCPGPALRLADESGQGATTASAIGEAAIVFAARGGTVQATPLPQSDAGNGATASAPTVLVSPPDEGATSTPLVAAAQSQVVESSEFVGLAAAACLVASGESWLVGGATTVGRTTLLTLTNPTEVPATVDLEIFGEDGSVAAPGTNGIIVPAGSQRILSLAGFIPGLQSPVVRVLSRGGQVVANLQQVTVRGLVPGGLDIVEPAAAPSTRVIIPGLLLDDVVAVEELLGGAGAEDLVSALRVFVPGTDPATVTVSLTPEDAGGAGSSFTIELAGGRATDLPLLELANGSYTVEVLATVPVLAGLRVSAAGASGIDFLWRAAAPELTTETLIAVPQGVSASVHLANPTQVDAEVTLDGEGTPDIRVLVPGGAAARVPVVPGSSYLATGFERIQISVSLTDDGMIAGYSIQPPAVSATPIRVFR